jgi:membrane protein implicated in regulation of membrane protease activity
MLIILAVVLLLVLPGPWDVIGFAVALALGVGELFLWNKTVKRQRRVVGAQTLIGADALVLAACRPDGQVRVNGEIWAARCEAGADEGETVRVVGRDRLTLTVDRAAP